jgi:predicted O-methyltransferase YrrM
MNLNVDVKGCISPMEGKLLETLALECNTSSTIVNIGVYKGKSLKYMLSNSRHPLPSIPGRKCIYAIDIKIRDDLVKNCCYIQYIQGRSQDVADQIPDDIELLFIDGSHTYDDALADMEIYWKKVVPGGVMLVHDAYDTNGTICEPDVYKAVRDFTEKHFTEFVPDNWLTSPIHRCDSTMIVQKKCNVKI